MVRERNRNFRKSVLFMLRKSIMEPISCVGQLIEKYAIKRRNFAMFFVDLEKVYYRVPKEVF